MEGLMEVVLLLGLFYWLFSLRARAMVDIMNNKFHEVYTNWAIRPTENGLEESRLTLTGLKRLGYQHKRNRLLDKEINKQLRDKHLYNVKENPLPEVIPMKPRPFMGLNCQNCIPLSRGSLVDNAKKNLNLKNILQVETLNVKNGILTRTFCYLSQCYRLKKFNYLQVSETVLRDERLKEALRLATSKECQALCNADDEVYEKIFKKNMKRAKVILYDMRSTLSDFSLRVTSWVLYKLLPCFLTSVVAHPGQIDMLKSAGESGLPLIFLPLHRSHLDYILISFILFINDVRAPLVAAGDNLKIPFFGPLLRGLGAFYIKRRIDPALGRKDIVYRAVLHTYMMEALRAGHNIEFFIEGGRTRTGKPCMPKGGILSVIVDAYMDGTIEDALLVPVSMNYERLVDGNFVREQLGQPKQMETFGSAIKGIWSVLNSNYGVMRIDFNQPFSIKELVKTFHVPSPEIRKGLNGLSEEFEKKRLTSTPSVNSLYGTDVVEEKHRNLVDSIARHVLYDCIQSTAIMSTNALAFLLLNQFRDGAQLEKLVAALDKLRNDLDWKGRDVGFTGDSVDVINHAVDVLGPALVRKEKQDSVIIRPISILPNIIELTYYSNCLTTFFAVDSVLATSLLILIPKDLNSASMLSQNLLVQRALELCEVLKYEFIFCKPCQNLEHTIIDAVDSLKDKEILCATETMYTENERWSIRYAKQFDDNSSDEESHNTQNYLKLNINDEAKEHLTFLCNIIQPLIETYTVTTQSLKKLVDRIVPEKDLLREILEELKVQLHMGFISHSESLSVESIKNCLKLLLHWNVLESYTQDKVRLYYLSDEYEDGDLLETVLKRIDCFKTTGGSVESVHE